MPESRVEFLRVWASLRSSVSQQLTTHAILILVWVLLYVSFVVLSGTSGRILIKASVIVFFGASLSYLVGRFLFYGNLGSFIESIRYHQIKEETVRDMSAQDLTELALENWQLSWDSGFLRLLHSYLLTFSGGIFSSWRPWIISLLEGSLLLLIHVMIRVF